VRYPPAILFLATAVACAGLAQSDPRLSGAWRSNREESGADAVAAIVGNPVPRDFVANNHDLIKARFISIPFQRIWLGSQPDSLANPGVRGLVSDEPVRRTLPGIRSFAGEGKSDHTPLTP
jgi:hypothetical protein